MQQAVAKLRLLLADIESRSQQAEAIVRQFRAQLSRIHRQAIYGRANLDMILHAMSEVEDRLADAEATLRRTETIRSSAQKELEALQLLQEVEEARNLLKQLKARAGEGGATNEETQTEIKRLEAFIVENSQRAGRAITTDQ